MNQFSDYDFRADGYRDGLAGKPCVPPAPVIIGGMPDDTDARQYRAGYRLGRIERDQSPKQKETRND